MASVGVKWTWVQIMALPLTGFAILALLLLPSLIVLFHKMISITSNLQGTCEDAKRLCLDKHSNACLSAHSVRHQKLWQ
jgi:hypothetical protein